tara:strand:- start:371 stop:1042 length:672 start_codon:yes stop_codon:yes gene_type:complete
MLISHKHKFIIIEIPKTGTTSLRKALRTLGVVDVFGKPTVGKLRRERLAFYQHGSIMDANEALKHRGRDLDEYFKFSAVRNPWNRYFSFLTYYKTKLKYYQETKEPLEENQQRQKKYILNLFGGKTDRQILIAIIEKFSHQKKYLININGDVVMDKIGQLENISNDFNVFCESAGIIPTPKLLHENKSDSQFLIKEELYTQELIDMVAKKEKWVIERFNYKYT